MTGAPLLMLIVIGFVLAGSGVVLTWVRVCLWQDMRRNSGKNIQKLLDRSARNHGALTDARDALASVIAETGGDTREQAVDAYSKVKRALEQETEDHT
jgi:hypothetical protein